MIPDGHTAKEWFIPDSNCSLLTRSFACSWPPGVTRRAFLFYPKPSHSAGNNRIDRNSLAWLNTSDSSPDFYNASQNLVAKNSRERAKGFHRRTSLKRQCTNIRSTNAGFQDFKPHPVVRRQGWLSYVAIMQSTKAPEHRRFRELPETLTQEITRNRDIETDGLH